MCICMENRGKTEIHKFIIYISAFVKLQIHLLFFVSHIKEDSCVT